MIASIRGRVLHLSADAVVVEVGGVGLSVQCAPRTAGRAAARAPRRALATTLVVREDSLTLFGFADAGEREAFEAAAVGQRDRAAHRSGGARRS